MYSYLFDKELLLFWVKENINWGKCFGEKNVWFFMGKCEKKEENLFLVDWFGV